MLQVAHSLFVVDQMVNLRVGAANRAIVRLGWELDFAEFHRERIVGEQVAREQIADTENVFDGFHGLEAADYTAHSANNACLLTGRHGIFRRGFLEDAAVAGALARNVRHELTLEADNARVRERLFGHDACIVDEELSREIIGSIDDEIVILDEVHDVFAGDEGVVRNHLHIRVHGFHRFLGGLHFGLAHILCGVDNLALQIGEVNDIGISNTNRANTCCGEVHGDWSTEATGADDEHLGGNSVRVVR